MKTNGILPSVKTVVLFLLSILLQTEIFAQPEYAFKNPSKVSGTSLQQGAIYLFQNVKPGVDARIEIKTITGGITIDEIDGTSSGFGDAFQPFINVAGKANGYIEFELKFYVAGTTTSLNQAYVPMTPIDVDGATYGNGVLYETDQIQLLSGYYNYSTSTNEIAVGQTSGWIWGRNTTGWSYGGIDTAAKNVMFTVVNGGVNTIRFRVGAQNSSTSSEVRLRSVYFQNFKYVNGILANSPLTDFSGNTLANSINLKYVLSEPEKTKLVVIEKAGTDMNFKTVQEVIPFNNKSVYEVRDAQTAGTSFYRLRIVQNNGQQVYSNVLRFENKNSNNNGLKVFPSVVQDKVTVQLQNSGADVATLQIYDYNGKMVHNQKITAQAGMQNFTVNGLENLSHGNYVVVARIGNELLQQKILKQ